MKQLEKGFSVFKNLENALKSVEVEIVKSLYITVLMIQTRTYVYRYKLTISTIIGRWE